MVPCILLQSSFRVSRHKEVPVLIMLLGKTFHRLLLSGFTTCGLALVVRSQISVCELRRPLSEIPGPLMIQLGWGLMKSYGMVTAVGENMGRNQYRDMYSEASSECSQLFCVDAGAGVLRRLVARSMPISLYRPRRPVTTLAVLRGLLRRPRSRSDYAQHAEPTVTLP